MMMSLLSARRDSRQMGFFPILFAEDFPVKILALPEPALVSSAPVPVSGINTPELSKKPRRNGSLSKIPLAFVISDWKQSSGSSMRAGMMLSGMVYRQVPLAPITRGTGSLSLPTATATMGDRGGRGDLTQALRGNESPSGRYTLPTLTARDWRSGKASEATLAKNSRPLNETIYAMGQTGRANPEWLELFMMFPQRWTDPNAKPETLDWYGKAACMDWATLSFRVSLPVSVAQ